MCQAGRTKEHPQRIEIQQVHHQDGGDHSLCFQIKTILSQNVVCAEVNHQKHNYML